MKMWWPGDRQLKLRHWGEEKLNRCSGFCPAVFLWHLHWNLWQSGSQPLCLHINAQLSTAQQDEVDVVRSKWPAVSLAAVQALEFNLALTWRGMFGTWNWQNWQSYTVHQNDVNVDMYTEHTQSCLQVSGLVLESLNFACSATLVKAAAHYTTRKPI